jgi:MFS family permease
MAALAVALGVGRFAFTPLLPLMLHGGALDLRQGGWLASLNYAGYFVGAFSCAALRIEPAKMVRACLAATVLLTLAMGVAHQFWVWAIVRFVGGAVSAWAFVFASQWGLRRLAELGANQWSGVIYTGPGFGIVGTGLFVGVAGGLGAAAGWIGFAVVSAVIVALVWAEFGDRGARVPVSARSAAHATNGPRATPNASITPAAPTPGGNPGPSAGTNSRASDSTNPGDSPNPGASTSANANASAAASPGASTNPGPNAPNAPSAAVHASPTHRTGAQQRADRFWLVLLYGIPGFGYIITATFLPVIARHALPGSAWPDMFWPMLGAALVAGALLAARLPLHWDNRSLLAACYVLQAAGVALGIVWPTAPGFSLGSLLIGLPFTAITLFAMRETRLLRGEQAAGLMGYATAAYGIGQIAGPLVAAPLAASTGSFSPSLWLAAGALMVGAAGLVWRVVVSPRARA